MRSYIQRGNQTPVPQTADTIALKGKSARQEDCFGVWGVFVGIIAHSSFKRIAPSHLRVILRTEKPTLPAHLLVEEVRLRELRKQLSLSLHH